MFSQTIEHEAKIKSLADKQNLKNLPPDEKCCMQYGPKLPSLNELLRHVTKSELSFLKFTY